MQRAVVSEKHALAALADDLAAIAADGGPTEIRHLALDCVMDTLGVAVAGSREPAVEVALGLVDAGSSGGISLIGHGRVSAPDHAAFVNGTAAHALDYDDSHQGFQGHPSTPVLAAVLSVGQARRCSGPELLTAMLAGIEAECLVGEWMGADSYVRGWHVTATLGALGAAAGCSVLLGLRNEATQHALALAALQASGLRAAFGTMGKPLQVGFAARAGVTAALLAERGATGPPDALDGPHGLGLAAAGVDGRPSRHEGEWRITQDIFKHHAACFYTHGAIDATRHLVDAEQLEAAAVTGVDVEVSPLGADVCDRPDAADGLDSKFSLQSNVARALLRVDTADPGSFSDAAAADPELRAQARKVHVSADAGLAQLAASVTVRTTSGERFVAVVDAAAVELDADRRHRRLVDKFERLAAPHVGRRQLDLLLSLEQLDDVDTLATALELPHDHLMETKP